VERTLIKFVYSWRKISRKDAYKGVSESAHIIKGGRGSDHWQIPSEKNDE